jgi:DegV family protein with EDD domain
MAVRIVTDSTCDLPADVIARHGITVVPLTILWDDQELLDGVDIDAPAFYERLKKSATLPKTSQPSTDRFIDAYRSLPEGDGIVSVHISSRMSGTINSATSAREQLGPERRIELVDSEHVSLGLGAVVLAAAEAAAGGASVDEVAAAARAAIPRIHVVALVDTLEFLRRGGRIGRARSLLGSLLSIKPILHIHEGEMAPLDRVRTYNRAVDRLVRAATEDPDLERLYVAAGGDDAAAAALAERIRPLLPGVDIHVGRIGPIVGVHAGPGVLGVCPVKRA